MAIDLTKKMVFIANDHTAIDLKNEISQYIKSLGAHLKNLGTDTNTSVDYPDYADKLSFEMKELGKDSSGILICGTGIGMSIAANRHPWIRAVVAEAPTEKGLEKLSLSRRHNNANVLCLGARFLSLDDVKKSINIFLKTNFEGDLPKGSRHKQRVSKL